MGNSCKLIVVFGFFLTVFGVAQCYAKTERPPTPMSLDGGVVIDAVQAKTLLDGGQALFFDTRSALNFGKGHIPGAVCLPYKEKSTYAEDFDALLDSVEFARLPSDKEFAIVFYSHGNTGWKSYKAAIQAISRGYSRVHWLREGFSSWKSKNFSIE